MKKKQTLLMLCSLLVLAACSKEKKTMEPVTMPDDITMPTVTEPAVPDSVFGLPELQDRSIPSAENHAEHLADPMIFADIPDQGITAEKTAVVGSDVCLFYPGVTPEQHADLEMLPEGIPVPLGTILPILGDRLGSTDGENYGTGMFSFQKNWNWFYPTEWKGQKGVVFGADLAGLQESTDNNRVTAMLYRTEGSSESFYPILGYRYLDTPILERIISDRLAIQAVDKKEYYLSSYSPDDMIALYRKHQDSKYSFNIDGRRVPIFVTTDLLSHTRHLIFDRTMQFVEEEYFTPRLKELCARFISELEAGKSAGGEETPVSMETREKAIRYFQVAQALLELAPEKMEEEQEWGPTKIVYQDPDPETVLSQYPELVREELRAIDAAAGIAISPLFTFADGSKAEEDYSQYKPRGHYTKNGILGAYFRAMMWFGRIHFLIADGGITPLSLENGEQASDSLQLTMAMQPIALMITELVRNDETLFTEWGALFDPITTLIGASDDLSFRELLPLWEQHRNDEFNAWITDRGNLLTFMQAAQEKLRPPAIAGSSVFWGPSTGDERTPPMGWRLFGQRFTWDSWIHHMVSPPRLMSRDMVRGLDIMKTFGSRSSEALLNHADYPTMEGLKERLDKLEELFASQDESFWQTNYYMQVLREIRALATFESGSKFYFTEGAGWNVKSLLSAHGAWAELRHDTILYVKQSYAERAGDGDFEPTFRTKPVPDPVHYIEPNLNYWIAARDATAMLYTTLAHYTMLSEETERALTSLTGILDRIIPIVRQEILNETVATDDVRWISTIPAELSRLVLVHTGRGDVIDEEEMRMALVADVFTNAELGLALETAVGIPYRIYVPLNDHQGGKRIAVGYCFSYYEFPQPMSDRLTNEQWKDRVYAEHPDLERYQPFWSKGRILEKAAK